MGWIMAKRRSSALNGHIEIDEERMEWYERIKSIGSVEEDVSREGAKSQRGLDRNGLRYEGEVDIDSRARDNRVRNSSGSFGSDRDSGDNHFQAENRGALERDNFRNTRTLGSFFRRGRDADIWFKRALLGKLDDQCGQSTVEYALVSVAFISIVLGLGVLSDLLTDGAVISHAINAASHGAQSIAGASDAFSF